jgi:hypothetical protein
MKRRQAYIHQNLLNAEFVAVEYRNAGDKNMHVFGVMKGVPASAGMLLLHICLPSIALFGLNEGRCTEIRQTFALSAKMKGKSMPLILSLK